jgi:hypothetical protein
MDAQSRQKDVVRALWDMCAAMHESADTVIKRKAILPIAARYAWALYHDMQWSGHDASPSAEMMKIRKPLRPDEPHFFDDLEAVEEFTDRAWAVLEP